jgi:hypothetical protein
MGESNQGHEGKVAMTGDKTDQARNGGEARPYPPSWADRHKLWVTRLPGPGWLYYLGLGLALIVLQAAILWAEGAYPVGTLVPGHLFIAGMMPLLLALCHFLDDRAAAALATLRPALTTSEEQYNGLRYQLTTMPTRPALLASLGGLAFILILNAITGAAGSFDALAGFPLSNVVIRSLYVVVWWFIAVFLYHTVHQSRTTHRIYTQHTHVNLFRLQPLYGLSGLTALTGASLAGITYGWMAINPGLFDEPIALAIVLPITILALAIFVWPLLGIHRLLAEAQERLIDECSMRLEATLAELHQRVDGGALEAMDDLNKAITSLELELNLLERIPTWPWRSETVRLLLTALALPLGLWLVQYVLQRLMEP